MKEDANEQLMTDVLDGVADAASVIRLAQRLADDPEALAEFERARLGARALEGLGLEEMPSDLRDKILKEVHSSATFAAETREASAPYGPERPRRMIFRARPAFRLALSFAAGAVAAVLAVGLVTDFWRLPAAERLPVEGSFHPRGERTVADLGGARVSLKHDESHAVVVLEVNEPGVSRAEVSFDPDRFEASSVRWIRGPRGAVHADGRHVSLVFHGRGTCEVGLRAVAKASAGVEVSWTGASGSRQVRLGAEP